MEDQLILVDANDTPIGTCPKLEAHEENLLHRAFSVFLFNEKGETLIQQRAWHKYHSAGLWANSCCSHPRPGEALEDACNRRLGEELGIGPVPLTKIFHTIYQVDLDKGLTEHEFVHVYVGTVSSDLEIPFNSQEIAALRWVSPEALVADAAAHPHRYAYWFGLYLTTFKDKVFGAGPKAP